MKALIFDSGPIINLSMNGLLYLLEELKKEFDGKFLITEEVKKEVVDIPINIKKFELGALRVQDLIDKGILEMPSSLGINNEKIKKQTKKLIEIANHFIESEGKWIKIVNEAEMSCLALSSELKKIDIDNIIAIDERTTRILGENPENLEKLMSDKLHKIVKIERSNFNIFSNCKFIRSSEIVYVAFKKKLINIDGKKTLEALLYATKFKGTAISFEEIEEMKNL